MQKILLKISKDNKHCGTLEHNQKDGVVFVDSPTTELKEIISNAIQTSIPLLKDVGLENSQVLIMEMINKDNPSFFISLIPFLENVGYKVTRRYPETESEIKRLLDRLPDSNEEKIDILKNLEDMSYLEQSSILEVLRD